VSRGKSLIKNTVILSIGTLLPKFLAVIITPILTSQLSKAEYGRYDLLTTLVILLLPISTMQISSAAFRFLIDKKADLSEIKKIISTILAFVICISIPISIIFIPYVVQELEINGLAVFLYFMSDILLITAQQIMRGLGKNLLYSVSIIIRSAVDVILVVLFTGVLGNDNRGLTGVVWAMLISLLSASVFLLIKGKILSYLSLKSVNISTLKELLTYSWPMIPNNLSGWVLRMSDRLVITAVLGIEANAVYAVANKMPAIFNSFQNAFALAWQENASVALNDDDKEQYYSKMCDLVYRVLTGVMAGLIMFTPVIWKLLVRGEYDEGYYQVPVLYLGMLFSSMSSTIGAIYIAHKKTRSVGITTMLAALLNFLIDILLVRRIGIWAGSISTMVSFFSLFVYRVADVQKFQKVSFDVKNIVLSIFLLSLMAVFSYQNKRFFDLLNVVLCMIILVVFERDIIIRIIKYKKRFHKL